MGFPVEPEVKITVNRSSGEMSLSPKSQSTNQHGEYASKAPLILSPFEILSATMDKPAYGAQLASMLGLTTATISHHTSALLDQNLLTLDKVDTKVYYRANPDMIRALINFVKKELLHE